MAARDCEISTESEDTKDFAEDFTAGKLLPGDVLKGSRDSGSEREDESEMGKVPFHRRHVEWEQVAANLVTSSIGTGAALRDTIAWIAMASCIG